MNTESPTDAANVHGKRPPLIVRIAARAVTSLVVLGALLFMSAGTFRYWHAWLYLATLFVPFCFTLSYFIKTDRAFLERRMQAKEKERTQKLVVMLSSIVFVAAFLIPGLDMRYGWSSVPLVVVICADVVVLAGYLLIIAVFKQNRFASRTVEVATDQVVVTTGLYSRVRHPMYAGVCLLYGASPLALGSYWALFPIAFLPLLINIRMKNEEAVLREKLHGYAEYCERVRWRIVPGIW